MGVLRAVWAVIIGMVVAVLIGAAFDYARIVFSLETENLVLVYPWVSGVGGLFAGITAVWIFSTGSRGPLDKEPRAKREPKVRQPSRREKQLAATRGGSRIKEADASGRVRISESADVPGMPTFELADDKNDTPGEPMPGAKEKK